MYMEGRQDDRFTPATMEAYGRLREDTRRLAEDMARSTYVQGQWADARGLEASAAVGMFEARIMQAVSVRLMQLTANACILHRVRGAMSHLALSTRAQAAAGISATGAASRAQ